MLDLIKKQGVIFGSGLTFGLGFCIAAGILYFVFQVKRYEPAAPAYEAVTATAPAAAKVSKFTFRNVEEVSRNGRSYFIGSVKNNGSTASRGATIEVNLFLKEKFVDQYSSYMTGELAPGEEKYFKISCGCKDETPAPHDSYKIAVIGGY